MTSGKLSKMLRNERYVEIFIGTQNKVLRICFGKNGRLILSPKRASPRLTNIPEKELENKLIQRIKSVGFNCKDCPANNWLMEVFKTKNICKENALAIAEIVSYIRNEHLPREYYRRKENIVFWIQEHFAEVTAVFSNYPTKIVWDGKLHMVHTPKFETLPKVQFRDGVCFFFMN